MKEAQIERVLKALGGWPRRFGADEKRFGVAMLARLIRERVIDEAIFFMVVRYATHAAKYEEHSKLIKAEALAHRDADLDADGKEPLPISLTEQARAYHANRVGQLEKMLLATPYDRRKAGMSAQSDFLDRLSGPETLEPVENTRGGTVTPLHALPRPARG